MKRLYIFFMIILPLSLYSTSLSHKEITKMVEKIKEERGGIGLDVLDNTPNPFAIEKEIIEMPKEVKIKKAKVEKIKEFYKLTAILNHKAFINRKWYGVGDKIGSYRVNSIGNRSVILKNVGEIKKLVIEEIKKKFKMFKGN